MKGKHHYFQVTEGVWGVKDIFVNTYLIALGSSGKWILIDAGLVTGYRKIVAAARDIFGAGARPEAILLTHGHFDHVGSLHRLLREWHVPVYAHPLEAPYLTGHSEYPPPDPFAGGGVMTIMAFFYPVGPINIDGHLELLTADTRLPFLPGWRYIHTPGHSPGHISLYRESDRLLIAGDAFVTTHQESLWSVITQKKIVSGPPRYFTCDWKAARMSVRALEALKPTLVATGHGKPMEGTELRQQLEYLSAHFRLKAVPRNGRYTRSPAITDETGIIYIPPPNRL